MKNLIFISLIIFSLCQCAENKHIAPIVSTPCGTFEGEFSADGNAEIFLGVPFAEPPIDSLRFMPPQKLKPFDGVKKCLQLPCSPMQPAPQINNCWTLDFQIPASPICEDCLYLNIWKPSGCNNDKLPVMVWIPGGGFVSGSGTLPIYSGENSAKKGVIFITLSYRVGIFGFFTHPELSERSPLKTSGNCGILDQVAALQWINENIEYFGGDKNNVTLVGQSAGAYSINALMVSPLAKNLFQKAILQSGGMVSKNPILSQSYADAEKYCLEFCEKNNLTLNDLIKMPAEKLLQLPFYQGITIDDKIVLNPRKAFENSQQNCKNIISGYTSQDGCNFSPYLNFKDYKFSLMLSSKYVDLQWFNELKDSTDSAAFQLQKIRNRLYGFGLESWLLAHFNALSGGNSYFYFFDRVPGGENNYGAFHSSEIAYALNNLDKWNYNFTENDKILSQNMNDYWINFAKTGNPNSENLPNWNKYQIDNPTILNLDTVIYTSDFKDYKYCKILDN